MTIEELLNVANVYCLHILQAEASEHVNHEHVMRCTAIAQACAQTAQTMILAKTARPDCDDTNRTFAVDTGN